MTKEERLAKKTQDAQLKAQNDTFKQTARFEALRTAQYIEKGNSAPTVLKTAENIYQWLVKSLK